MLESLGSPRARPAARRWCPRDRLALTRMAVRPAGARVGQRALRLSRAARADSAWGRAAWHRWALSISNLFNPETGLPRSFLELTAEEHLAVWRGAPDGSCSVRAFHAALVVSLHARSLSELRMRGAIDHLAPLQAHVDEERARQVRLRATLGVSESQARRTQRQMWTWDGLSLALCNGWRPFVARDVPSADGLVNVELRDGDNGASTLDPAVHGRRRGRAVRGPASGGTLRERERDETRVRAARTGDAQLRARETQDTTGWRVTDSRAYAERPFRSCARTQRSCGELTRAR